MDTIGSRQQWVSLLRVRDDVFVRFVVKVWWEATAQLPRNACENAITRSIVLALSADADARALFYCDYQFPPIDETASGRDRFIDIGIIYDNDRRTYLGYECKKLNVIDKRGGRSSHAAEYVGNDGLMRFVTEKYAKGMPVACMMGYVMDGDVAFASSRIKAAIGSQRSTLRLQEGPRDEPPLDVASRFVTTHNRPEDEIEIRHTLLPFVRSTRGDTDV